METGNVKNIIVLKNLPSNLVDEAIVFLKANKNAKKLEYVEKNSVLECEEDINKSDYVIREAESVILDYISNVEENDLDENKTVMFERKYRRLKVYSKIVSVLFLILIISVIAVIIF